MCLSVILKRDKKWETFSQIPLVNPGFLKVFLFSCNTSPNCVCGWYFLPCLPPMGSWSTTFSSSHLQSILITLSHPTNKNFAIVFRGTRRDFQGAELYRVLSRFNQDVGCTIQYWLCNQKARRNTTQMNYYGKIVLIMGSWSIEIYIYNALSNYIMQGNKLC